MKAAAHLALDKDFTRYTPVPGIADLRHAICERYKADYGVEYQDNEVIVTAGGKQALYNTALTLFGPGDDPIGQVARREARPVDQPGEVGHHALRVAHPRGQGMGVAVGPAHAAAGVLRSH